MSRLLLYMVLIVGSFVIPRLLVILGIMLSGSREVGMVLGYNVGLVVTWLLFPIIKWRPFTKLSVITAIATILSILLLVQLPIFSWLKLPNDDYGIQSFTLTFCFYAVLLFELSSRYILKIPSSSSPA